MSLQRCRVVLVRTQFAGNIGATARVMKNMGLSDLVLVAPEADPHDRNSHQLSTHGEELLHRARIVAELGEAVGDCLVVAATTARLGGLYRRQPLGWPDEIMPKLLDRLDPGPVALIFGPERSGLTNEEIARCHHLIHIPADDGYPALNLAQAVAICLYELRRQFLRSVGRTTEAAMPATFAHQEQMFRCLRAALEAIHFLYGPKADPLMHALRHLIGRAQPTTMEVDVLLGLARQMQWLAENGTVG